eukprot:TRINITY_DN65076_c0_g1_i1.p1 TRINITY_DN65076_c0_g1~~TRINITY_DN65076_c0_g1_i1.p1  ORF type:complete len:938 (-),score=240.00 TRINITY_DN65076_c0_g1_i1:79-2892(-)
MSADAKILHALAGRTRCELLHFELVRATLHYKGAHSKTSKGQHTRFYLCVGRHALWLVRPSMTGVLPGGELPYIYLEQVVEDVTSPTGLVLQFNLQGTSTSTDEADPRPQHLALITESRAALVSRISVAYVADAMFRLGEIVTMPRFENELALDVRPGRVRPYYGFKQAFFKDYGLWLHNSFAEVADGTSKTGTGRFVGPIDLLSDGDGVDLSAMADMQVEVTVHVYDPVHVAHLPRHGREHVRWMAMEYRSALVHEQDTYVVRNQPYNKKMNLANDPAAWTCWEQLLKGQETTTMLVLMRRHYMPPMCDHVQDCALLFRCPTRALDSGLTGRGVKEEDLRQQAHIAVDSFCTVVLHPTLYPELIQAKLDALLFDEDSYSWLWSRMRMRPRGECLLEFQAFTFMKALVNILRTENVLEYPGLLDDMQSDVAEARRANETAVGASPLAAEDEFITPLEVVDRYLRFPACSDLRSVAASDEELATLHDWQARVARYLAFAVDGGLLGARFSLADIVTVVLTDAVLKEPMDELQHIIAYLLHVRPKDLTKPFDSSKDIDYHLGCLLIGDDVYTFNDRVMQGLLELGYLRKMLPVPDGSPGAMSRDFAMLLSRLLTSNVSSVDLKAAICRLIVKEKDTEQGSSLCAGLIEVLKSPQTGIFLATYACAALVNLSQAQEVVKNRIMHLGVAPICVRHLQSKDDDLVLYCLMLLVHLSKYDHHRQMLKEVEVVAVLTDLLIGSYGAVRYRRRVLMEIASVLGQMCNDEEIRTDLVENTPVVDCLLAVFDSAHSIRGAHRDASLQLASKVIFALKQLCVNSPHTKEQVGMKVLKTLIDGLRVPRNLDNRDWAVNAVLLLILLAISKTCCELMVEAGWEEAHRVLLHSALGTLDVTRDRLYQIDQRVEQATKAALADVPANTSQLSQRSAEPTPRSYFSSPPVSPK